jgi:Calcineurin-like phosphoesterase
MSTKKSGKKTPNKVGTAKAAQKSPAASAGKKASKEPVATPGRRAPLNPPVNQQPAAKNAAKSVQPIRWAHPFFTTTPKNQRKPVPGIGTSLIDHVKGNLEVIPAPDREPVMTLGEIIGQAGSDEIQAARSILFHTVGDTGRGMDTPQGTVAEAMVKDFNISNPTESPAFFFHLGDVIYGPNKDARFKEEFYEPYVHYPGKIVAIPGNHDGEVLPTTDPVSLRAFLANFCAAQQAVPAVAGTIYRETLNLPGVYYLLDAPFVQIIALYSNAAENPGFISGQIPGQAQKQWLQQTLQKIASARAKGTRKALVMATHHPPFTAGGHSPSTEMLQEIDTVCQAAGIMPDMYLSGHAHSYQRYTRDVTAKGKKMEIPYVVVGTGGINDQAVPKATGAKTGDHTFVSSFKGYGYMLVEVTAQTITGTVFTVDQNTHARTQFEQFTVDLQTSTVRNGM